MTDKKELARQCITMLERYYEKARALPNNNSKVLTLEGQDMADWKNSYYPQLVQSGLIRDGSFFQNPVVNSNYGIGADGAFTKYEYVQYLWSAYKYIVTDFSANSGVSYIRQCIDMLEPYTVPFENHLTETTIVNRLNSDDMFKWKYECYPYFSKSGLVPDGQFFGDVAKDANYGIGADGAFSGEELCHFLYQLYRFADSVISKDIPTWKVLFLLCKNTTFDGVNIYLSQQDINDMKNAMRRFQNFVFAFSGGRAAVEIIDKDIEYPVNLHKDTSGDSDNFFIPLDEFAIEDGLEYILDNAVDAAICYARYGKFSTSWSSATMFGNITYVDIKRYFTFANLKGLEDVPNDKYLEASDVYPFPEEAAVREFCHTLKHVFEDLYKFKNLVNSDDAEKYGYKNQTPDAPIGGYYSFYQDILSGRVKDSGGAEIGVKPEMWSNTMRKYNESLSQKLRSAAAVYEDKKPVVTDLKVFYS